jgi:hypothetical protein
MRPRLWSFAVLLAIGLIGAVSAGRAAMAPQERGGQEEFGPYELVENWPQPLPDGPDGVKHAGWTWGSVGAVYAETPDRIWIAQRGELPLPEGAKPWTPYSLLQPPRTATGNTDGLSATCETVAKRGWERRWHHSVFVVDRNGKVVQDWPHPRENVRRRSVRARAPQDQDEPVRPREARVDYRRPTPRDLEVHL